jgi:hypothetical protein
MKVLLKRIVLVTILTLYQVSIMTFDLAMELCHRMGWDLDQILDPD